MMMILVTVMMGMGRMRRRKSRERRGMIVTTKRNVGCKETKRGSGFLAHLILASPLSADRSWFLNAVPVMMSTMMTRPMMKLLRRMMLTSVFSSLS